ncbi:unnamed protein product [Pleuronectes platessa]|uniref:Uncharacterized protein n=1 Tax=Pleuronectes platessa TaxID=8262 RepID=A0A9N7UH76_PLEPL|nr:unnamed protein product [Pleuronectes platessa]
MNNVDGRKIVSECSLGFALEWAAISPLLFRGISSPDCFSRRFEEWEIRREREARWDEVMSFFGTGTVRRGSGNAPYLPINPLIARGCFHHLSIIAESAELNAGHLGKKRQTDDDTEREAASLPTFCSPVNKEESNSDGYVEN